MKTKLLTSKKWTLEQYIVLILVVTSANLCKVSAQAQSVSDTIKINDVVVMGRPMLEGAGFLLTTIEKGVLEEHPNRSISDILINGSPFFIKSYGPGGLATLSFRGGGASHTVVTWNGINMNSPMLGQTDLQLIPEAMIDDIKIYQGGSTVAAAQGGLGGVIDITSKPTWNDAFSNDLSVSVGGYGRYATSLNSKYGKDNWRFTTRLNYNYGANDFKYINDELPAGPVEETRTNASFVQKAAMQEVWYRGGKSITGLRAWYQTYDREVPLPINIPDGTYDENLSGNTFRSMLTHDRFGENILWSGVFAFVNDNITYREDVSGYISPSSFNRITLRGSGLWNERQKISLKGELTSEFEQAISESFDENISRNITYLSAATDLKPGKAININLNIVLPMIDGNPEFPDLSAGMELYPAMLKMWKLSSNIAYKSKIPTMNDLYWIYGGNPSLLPERAVSSEIAIARDGKVSKHISLNFRTGVYLNNITDMILWLPGESGLWAPENIGQVHGRGSESHISITWARQDMTVQASADYSFNRSSEEKSGPQMIYVPKHMAGGAVRVTSGKIISGISLRHTGKVFVTSDNSDWLSSYTITDLWGGVKLPVSSGSLDATVRIENLFNVNYQVVQYYPMPQNSVTLNLSWNFRKVAE